MPLTADDWPNFAPFFRRAFQPLIPSQQHPVGIDFAGVLIVRLQPTIYSRPSPCQHIQPHYVRKITGVHRYGRREVDKSLDCDHAIQKFALRITCACDDASIGVCRRIIERN